MLKLLKAECAKNMLENRIKNALKERFLAFNIDDKALIFMFEKFEKFYSESTEFAEKRLQAINFSEAQKKALANHHLTDEEKNLLLNDIHNIPNIAALTDHLAHIIRNQLAVIRSFSRLTKDEESRRLITQGMQLNQQLKKNGR